MSRDLVLRVSRDFGAFPAQRRFLASIADPKVYATGYIGGYGAGKTRIGAVGISLASAMNPGLDCLAVSPTYRMLKDVTWPTVLSVLDENEIPHRERRSDWRIELPAWNGAINFRSADRPESLKGPNIAAAWLDEGGIVAEAAAREALVARVRHPKAKHRTRFVTTTPEGFNWCYDWFGASRPGHVMINAPTTDNKALPADYVDQLRESMDDQHAAAYIEGRFCSLFQRQVYYNFDRAVHAQKRLSYNPDLPLFWSQDFNVHPMCGVVFQMPNTRTVHVIGEIVLPGSNTPAAADEFVLRYAGHRGLLWISGDASGRARDTRQESHRSDFEIMVAAASSGCQRADVQTMVARKNPALSRRHNLVNALLRNAKGAQSLFVDPVNCPHTIQSFERTVRKEGSQQVDKGTEWKVGRHSFVGAEHLTDALGYPLCEMFPDPAAMRGAA